MTDDGKSCAAIRAELAEAKALVARWVDAATMAIEKRDAAIRERDAYKRAKAENDDRFMGERDEARRERDALRAELDALKAPIAGVEELARIGWEAWQRVSWPDDPLDYEGRNIEADTAEVQAIASRLIGALRASLIEAAAPNAGLYFDRAVASLKIDAKPKGPPWLADAAEALGQVADDGSPFALNWSQVLHEIRALRRRFDAEAEHHKLTIADRDKWLAEAKRLATPEPIKALTDTRPIVKVESFVLTPRGPSYWDQVTNELTTVRERLAKLEAGK